MPQTAELSWAPVWRALRRRWWVIAVAMVLCGAAAAAQSASKAAYYEATARILFRNPGFDQLLSGSSVQLNSVDPARDAATNVELVSSDSVSRNTDAALRLPRDYTKDHTKIEALGETNVVGVTVTDEQPVRAARIANRFAIEFIRGRRIADQQRIGQAAVAIEAQLRRAPATGDARTSLQQRLETLRTLSALQTGNAEIAQGATPPENAAGPRTVRNTILGLVLGGILGLAIVLVADRLDRRIRDADELVETFSAPLLASVPNDKSLQTYRGAATDGLPISDAFRLLRASLRYFDVDRPVKAVLITSAQQGEGKSVVSVHLADALASSGRHTLLLELDLRRPQLARRLGAGVAPGVTEVLSHQSAVGDALQTDIGGRAGFDYLPAGSIPPNAAELLESEAMVTLLNELTTRYDAVVIDAPPVAVVADVAPLLSRVDGVLVVGRVGFVLRDRARRLHELLEGFSAPVLGVVANGVRTNSSYYTYGQGDESSGSTQARTPTA